MTNNIMTDDKRKAIIELIQWFWKSVNDGNQILHKSDYEFLYDIWDASLSMYSTEVQTRLNQIRDTYLDYKPDRRDAMKL